MNGPAARSSRTAAFSFGIVSIQAGPSTGQSESSVAPDLRRDQDRTNREMLARLWYPAEDTD